MTVQTHDPSQILTLQEHLDAAAALDSGVLDDLRALARQLDGHTVLPLIGAGGSYDCGMPLAGHIGENLRDDYYANPSFDPHTAGLQPDMADVAEEIFIAANQTAVVQALGIPDPALWPPAHDIDDHFCGYRVLARLAREDLYTDAVTLNYDCAYEAGLQTEGFTLARGATPGGRWRDHVTLIADPEGNNSTVRPGSLALRKLHGCAAHYRDEVDRAASNHPEDRIVIRRRQLLNWRQDIWARDYLRHAARTSILLLLGFSAGDPDIVGELYGLLSDVYASSSASGEPRIIVIDPQPDTPQLHGLIHAGLGDSSSAPGAITKIRTRPATTTATLLALLTETLHHHLQPAMTSGGLTLPGTLDPRMAALSVAAPVMLRWSYLLRPSQDEDLNQRANLQSAARHGYVPLRLDGDTTVRALRTRAELRATLGRAAPESTREALENHSFLTDPARGVAYLPCGLDLDTLRGGARPAGELQTARETLPWPERLECVIVAESPAGWRGVSLATGREVPVP
ncbi:MAG: SIR2 family protein [Solirubrobacteraceae bacterium]